MEDGRKEEENMRRKWDRRMRMEENRKWHSEVNGGRNMKEDSKDKAWRNTREDERNTKKICRSGWRGIEKWRVRGKGGEKDEGE
jgi:hypothetical protein